MQEARRFQIEHANGILSPQTWSQRLGLDYEQEQANITAHGSRAGKPTLAAHKPSEIDAGALPLDVSAGKLLGVAQNDV
jgi:hypothetical protein